MVNEQFKVGDCVRIKYGNNPSEMNVNEVKNIPITGRIEVWCKWFNTKEQRWEYESFSPEVLIHCDKSNNKI